MSSSKYDLEYWEFDFLARHLINNEEIDFYEENDYSAEIVASTERQGSTVIFHAKRDRQNTWLDVFSMDEGECLGSSYLESMTERRIESIAEESRKAYGLN